MTPSQTPQNAVPPPSWSDASAPLRKFAAAFGFDPARSFEETPDDLTFHSESFKTDKLNLLTDPALRKQQLTELNDALQEMKQEYGPGLVSLEFRLAQKDFKVQEQYQLTDLEAFCEHVSGSSFELDLNIDKTKLPAHWGIAADEVDFRVFFNPAALARSLNVSLEGLERGEKPLLREFTGEKKLIILMLDHDIELNGDYLAILGKQATANLSQYLPSRPGAEARKKISFVYKDATDKPKWGDIKLNHLTPLQLHVDWPNSDAGKTTGRPTNHDIIAGPLFAQLVASGLLYLATYSRKDQANPPWVATFAEDKYLAHVEVGETAQIVETLLAADTKDPWQAPHVIGDLVEWVYSDERGVANRLRLTQAVIASQLQDKKTDRVLELLRNSSEVFDKVQERWDVFMSDKLDKYFSNIKALEETVEATSKTYNEQVQSLTKTLTDNILAAVGVVVGSFLVAIFKSPFQSHIFRFGTVTYLIYLVVFPIGIGLIAAWQRFSDSKRLFQKRQLDFGNRLPQSEVAKIVGNSVVERESWFKKWFAATVILYVLIASLMGLAIWKAPNAIKRWTDDFTLTEVSYGTPEAGPNVAVTVRGENFYKDKEIVVRVGNSSFSNTGKPSLNVLGSTVLTFSAKRRDLDAALASGNSFVAVRQANTVEKTRQLPPALPPSRDPVFEGWSWQSSGNQGGTLAASGSNLGSIAAVEVNGRKLEFQISSDGTKLEFSGLRSAKELDAARMRLTLFDGRLIPITVMIPPN